MMRSSLALSVSLFAITLGASAHAGTKVTETFQLKNYGFSASFFGSDSCSAASMSVYFSQMDMETNGVPANDPPTTFVVFDYQNICNGANFQASGTTFQQQFTVAGDLSSATLYAVVPVTTDENAPVQLSSNVVVNLAFTATGASTTFKQKEHSKDGGVKFKFTATSTGRPAQAYGTATVDFPFAGGDDTPIVFFPSVDGSINKNLMGSVTVTKTK